MPMLVGPAANPWTRIGLPLELPGPEIGIGVAFAKVVPEALPVSAARRPKLMHSRRAARAVIEPSYDGQRKAARKLAWPRRMLLFSGVGSPTSIRRTRASSARRSDSSSSWAR
jgi:hypothetical protein